MNERTVRKWLVKGKLQGHYDGRTWTVYLEDMGPEQTGTRYHQPGPGPERPSGGPDVAALVAALERSQRENVELAGRCGFLQARVQQLEGEVKALQAPREPEPSRPALWRRLLGLSPA